MKSFCLTRGQLKVIDMERYFAMFPPEFNLFIFSSKSYEGDLFQGRMMSASKQSNVDFKQWLEGFKKL